MTVEEINRLTDSIALPDDLLELAENHVQRVTPEMTSIYAESDIGRCFGFNPHVLRLVREVLAVRQERDEARAEVDEAHREVDGQASRGVPHKPVPLARRIQGALRLAYEAGAMDMREAAAQACRPMLRDMASRSTLAADIRALPLPGEKP